MPTQKRWPFLFGALFSALVFLAASIGYWAGIASDSSDEPPSAFVTDSSTIVAFMENGETSTLSSEEAEIFEENTTPLDPSDVTFSENEALTTSEIEDRKDELSANYTVGQPLSLEDLEFMRAYLIEEESSPDTSGPSIQTASFSSSASPVIPAALFDLNQSFNVTKSGAGTTTNATGRITGGINLADATWGASWTTKRTAGLPLTKIKSWVKADAFGAVAAWPFVGLIYSQTLSSTSPTGASSWSFSRSGRVTGVVAYMQIDCRSYIYTSSGTYSLP